MKVLTEEQITDAVLYKSDMNGSFSEAIAFAREIEAEKPYRWRGWAFFYRRTSEYTPQTVYFTVRTRR